MFELLNRENKRVAVTCSLFCSLVRIQGKGPILPPTPTRCPLFIYPTTLSVVVGYTSLLPVLIRLFFEEVLYLDCTVNARHFFVRNEGD
jgi:hypothetical protein